MSVFTTTITGVRTYDTPGLENNIKEVDWILEGKDGLASFNVATTSTFSESDPVYFSNATQEELVMLVSNTSEYLVAKSYIESQISEQLAKINLVSKPLPWNATS